MENVVAIRLSHSGTKAVDFVLEPWGEVYRLSPDSTLEIVARGPEGDTLEVEAGGDQLIVYAWPGSVVQLYLDGTEIDVETGQPPAAPPLDALPRKRVTAAAPRWQGQAH